MRVVIVADKTAPITLQGGPIWVRKSPEHQAAAEALWASGGLAPDQVTIFSADDDASSDEACADILDTVELHHPNWTELEIAGVQFTAELASCLSELGAVQLIPSSGALLVKRS